MLLSKSPSTCSRNTEEIPIKRLHQLPKTMEKHTRTWRKPTTDDSKAHHSVIECVVLEDDERCYRQVGCVCGARHEKPAEKMANKGGGGEAPPKRIFYD